MVYLTNDIKKLLDLTNLVLLDIKHIDDKKCKNLVGKSNKLELEFARYLSENNIPIWIRQVIIPGITDDVDDLLKLKQFISTLNSVKKVELLPFCTFHLLKQILLMYFLMFPHFVLNLLKSTILFVVFLLHFLLFL